MRFICTLQVVIHHLNLSKYSSDTSLIFLDKYFFHTGRGAVSFFFFLSGFIICYSSRNWRGWKSYLIRRFLRVFPNHWIVSLTFTSFAFIAPIIDGQSLYIYLTRIALNLLLLQSYVPYRNINFDFNGVTWTLSLEITFYLLFLYFRKISNKQLIITILLLLFIKISLETFWYIYSIQAYKHWLFFVFPLFRLPEFLIGILLCRLYLENKQVFMLFRFDPLLIVFMNMVITGLFHYYISTEFIYLYSTIPAIFGFLILLSCLSISNNSKSYLNNKCLLFLGESSFAIYLIHQPIFNGARKFIPLIIGFKINVEIMLIIGIISIIIAILYFYYVEQRISYNFRKRMVK